MKMHLVIDLIAAAIIIVTAVVSARKGFLKTVISACWLVVSVICGIVLRPVFFAFYGGVGLLNRITEGVTSKALEISGGIQEISPEKILEGMKLPQHIKENIISKITFENSPTKEELCEKIGSNLGRFSVNCISFLTGFAAAIIVILIILAIIRLTKKLPVIGGLDRFLGAVTGVVISFTFIYLAVTAIYALAGVGYMKEIAAAVDNTVITKFVYEYNPVTYIIWKKSTI